MEETIRAMNKRKLTPIEYAELDVAFHKRLALASGNLLFSALVNTINDVMVEVRLRAISVLGETRFIADAIEQHSRIFERVKAHDVEGARQAMEDHLRGGRDLLRQTTDEVATAEQR
jgi:GntR family transcriptional regulator, transcriptional repressor for pyruvate dehydrogenase complex